LFQNSYFFYLNIVINSINKQNNKTSITFICDYHGETGGTIAIASIANLLAQQYNVHFWSYPSSDYNRKLASSVRVTRQRLRKSDIYLCDASCDHQAMLEIRRSGGKIIVSCHGLPQELHGIDPGYIRQSLELADRVHFVSQTQQQAFQLEKKKYVIIPNTSSPVSKTQTTNNIGTVGNLDEPRKGAKQTVAAGILSSAEEIHLWSTTSDQWHHEKIRSHSWENNKKKIYDSFDVLAFLSIQETFGLVVIEAMSAGIPCVLRRLPAFIPYQDCPGVVLTDSQDPKEIARIIDDLLLNKDQYRSEMRTFFRNNYSGASILTKWELLISDTLEVSDQSCCVDAR
jgi:glycosyltransferase involved in cell wall biosynthesis